MKEFSPQKLRQFRARAGLSQSGLAQKSGVPANRVSKLEHGHVASPSIGTVSSLAEALGCTFDDLLNPVA